MMPPNVGTHRLIGRSRRVGSDESIYMQNCMRSSTNTVRASWIDVVSANHRTDHSVETMKKMDDISRPVIDSESSAYQAWLESRIFPSSKVHRLAHEDLRAFKSAQPCLNTTSKPSFPFLYLAYTTLINAVLPLLIFKLVNGVLNRLILLSSIVAVGASVQDRLKTKVMQEEMACTVICVCISVFAAICL